MEAQTLYMTRFGKKPTKASLLLKAAAHKNAVMLREKTIEEQRELKLKLAAVRIIPLNLEEVEVDCSGVPCEWIYPKEGARREVVVYLHGGSWAFGNLRTAKAVGALLAEGTGCRVLVVEYRLAPEHPFPAGLEDCLSVYRWLLEKGTAAEQIAIFGDSAGGNLSLSLLQKLRTEGVPLPASVALASPVTDLRESCALLCSGDDLLYTIHDGQEWDIFSLYLGNYENRNDPLVSPILGDLSELCPILLHTGGDEPLCADNIAFAEAVWRAGSPVYLKVWEEMFHDFTIVGVTLKESRQSMGELCDFILGHF